MRKQLKGKVVSDKQKNTVVVIVERKFAHLLYKKIIKRNKRYQVHNEKFELKAGDEVLIEETKPISKTKHFAVVKKL